MEFLETKVTSVRGAGTFVIHKGRPWRKRCLDIAAAAGALHRARQTLTTYTTFIRIYGCCKPEGLAIYGIGAYVANMRLGANYNRGVVKAALNRLRSYKATQEFCRTYWEVLTMLCLS